MEQPVEPDSAGPVFASDLLKFNESQSQPEEGDSPDKPQMDSFMGSSNSNNPVQPNKPENESDAGHEDLINELEDLIDI